MSVSSIKKIKNEMDEIEKNSDRFIPSEKYYVIYLKFENRGIPLSTIKNLGKLFLNRNPDHSPLSVYTFEDEFSLVFSSVDENLEHYKKGSQQKIMSEYISYTLKKLGEEISQVNCSIIEFQTQIQIISYFILKIYTNSRKFMLCNSNKKITEEDAYSKTFSELIDQLKDCGYEWSEIPSEEKYGIFLKLKKHNEKYVISTLSENFDARNTQKYLNYIFGS